MSGTLDFLCAGAVQGLVKALQARFSQETGIAVQGRFGAVGAMKEALLAGEPCDVMIVTDAMVLSLQDSGALDARPRTALGRVRTGMAVRAGEPLPDVATPESLKACLLSATALYVPDTERSTAGIHFLSVLRALGIDQALAPRLRIFPNGATAMRELASSEPGAIGCTQITEILYTPGIALVGALPQQFELATVYSAAVTSGSARAQAAQRFVDLLGSADTRAMRAGGGFEFD